MLESTQRLVFRLILLFSLLFGVGLAAHATQVTISAAQIPNVQAGAGTYELRIWLDRTMVDSLGVTYPGGAVDSPANFKRVSCSLVSTTVTCDSFQLASTKDAQQGADAKYTAKLYRNGAPLLLYNKPFWLTAALGASVTWEQIWRDNNGVTNRALDDTFWTKNQVIAHYAGGLFSNPATTTSRGVGKSTMNVADPVFVETTDPRLPTQGENDALAGTSGTPSSSNPYVTSADARLGAGASTWTDLCAAVTAIGSTPQVLDITTALPSGGSCSVPVTLTLHPMRGGSVVLGSGHTITYLADTRTWPVAQIFSGSGVLSLAGNSRAGDLLPEWWGANAADSSDDNAAVQAAITADGTRGGGIVSFGVGTYRVTGLTVSANYVRLKGKGWASRIAMTSGTGDTLTFSNGASGMTLLEDDTYLTGVGLESVRLEPTVTRTSGAEIVAYRWNKLYLNGLVLQGTPGTSNVLYQGIRLGRVGDIGIDTFISQLRMRAYKFGIKMTNVIDCFADSLALDKFDQTDNTYSVWLSGLTSGLSATNWEIVNSKYAVGPTANNVIALYLHNDTGLTGPILLANFFTNCYFDSHTVGVRGDDGTGIGFTNCWFSDVGAGGVPGYGVYLAGGTDWNFTNCVAMNCGGPGFYLGGGGLVTMVNCNASGNNQQGFSSAVPESAGIYLNQFTNGYTKITNCTSTRDRNIWNNPQQWGIWVGASSVEFEITGNYLKNNAAGPLVNLAGLSPSQRIHHNEGWVTENSSVNAVLSGTTSIAFAHGLSLTPSAAQIVITPTSLSPNAVRYWVLTDATNITVYTSGDPGVGGYTFGWSVKVQ